MVTGQDVFFWPGVRVVWLAEVQALAVKPGDHTVGECGQSLQPFRGRVEVAGGQLLDDSQAIINEVTRPRIALGNEIELGIPGR